MDKIYETYGKIYEEIIPSTSYIPIIDIMTKYSFPINFHQRKIIFLCQSNRQIVRFSRIDILDQGVIEVHKAKSLRVIGKRI